MTLPPVTVVVACHRQEATLRACLDAVVTSDYPDLAVVVVDTAGDAATQELLARHHPGVRVLSLPGLSAPAALNRAFALAAGRDVVRLHGDVVPQRRDWLRTLALAAQSLPHAGVVGVKLVHANGRIQSAGRDLVTGLGFGHHHEDRRAGEADGGGGGAAVEVDSVRGACAWYRRAVLDRVQLDENYAPAHGDDDDFCLAARYHGFSVWCAPDVSAIHYTPHQSRMTGFSGLAGDPRLVAALTTRDQCRQRAFDYFLSKWGFDPLGPDLHEVRRRYGHTAICWRIGDSLRYAVTAATPAVDVAFVTCNSARILPQMLAALGATRWPDLRAFVVDNASSDDTMALLEAAAKELPFPLHIERLPVNVGVVPALNRAIQLGSAPLIARLDDDAIVEPDWLERLVPRFRQRPFAGVVAPRILNDGPAQTLQARPIRAWPQGLPIENDAAPERFDGLMRTSTLCGCCNLYRRDVFANAGFVDIRYAPTQYDDTDHHIAVANRGYEILHDGTATVRHLLQQGRSQTHAAMASAQANQQKLVGKWGADAAARLDRGIDLSLEGRVLPRDGDTAAFLAALPPPPPLEAPPPAPVDVERERLLAARHAGFAPDGMLDRFGRAMLQRGHEALARGKVETCSAYLWLLMDAFPHLPEVHALHARHAAAAGDQAVARRALARGLALAPDDASLRELAATLRLPEPPTAAPLRPGRVLVLPPFGAGGSDRTELAHALASAHTAAGDGPAAVAASLGPPLAGVEMVHAFDLGDPVRLLDQVKAVRVAAPRTRILLSPWTCDPEPAAWAAHVLPAIFRQAEGDAQITELLARAAAGQLEFEGSTARRRAVVLPEWTTRFEQEVLACVDELVPFDGAELDRLAQRHFVLPPHRAAAWPTPAPASAAAAAAFAAAHDATDFVLLPGPVQPEHNQLVALFALRDVPCVVLGPYPDAAYAELCRRFAGPRTRFLPALAEADLAAAVAAADVVVWPSLCDRPTAALLHARAAQRSVVCCGTALARGLGDLARAVDACDVAGLQAAASQCLSGSLAP